MTADAAPRQDSLLPALIAALALHLGLFAALTLFRPDLPLPLGSSVPINIVSQAPAAPSRAAEPAPQAQTAQVEQPVPQAPAPTPPPSPVAPAPAPAPAARAVQPVPKPTPAPAVRAVQPVPKPALKPMPAPPRPTPTPRDDNDFLNALAAAVRRSAPAQRPAPASGARGPTRAATAPASAGDPGPGVSQSDIQGLSQLLNKLWLKNCDAASIVDVTVRLIVDDDGRVASADAGGRQNSSDPAVSASAIRAIGAVHQAAPYAEEFRGKRFTINFDASKACSSR